MSSPDVELPLNVGSSDSAAPGGESSSSPGSSSIITATTTGDAVRAAREAMGWTRTKLDKEAQLGSGGTKAIEEGTRTPRADVLARLSELLAVQLEPTADPAPPVPADVSRGTSAERRPAAAGTGRRGLLRRAKTSGPDGQRAPATRPSLAGRRVSTSPLTESVLTFVAGGTERIGQGPLGAFTAFSAPVAGEIVDDVVAGTVVDRLVQPLVKGSEKYQNLGALVAGYASIAWATNVPEAEPQAFALFQWSMTTLLPLQGAQMVKRAKEQEKAAEALAKMMPDLANLVPPAFANDPIRGLWAMMWARPPEAAPPVPADEPATAA